VAQRLVIANAQHQGFKRNDPQGRGHRLVTRAADTASIMAWLLARLRKARVPADPYRGAVLGVECAWPNRFEHGVTHSRS